MFLCRCELHCGVYQDMSGQMMDSLVVSLAALSRIDDNVLRSMMKIGVGNTSRSFKSLTIEMS